MTLPYPHEWDHLIQQFRQEVMADIQRLKRSRPADPLSHHTIAWMQDALTLQKSLNQLQRKLTTMQHTASILQGKEPYGAAARPIKRVGDEN